MAETAFIVPLQATNQRITISLAGVQYQLTVRWNNINEAWSIDLADASGTAIISGIPMVTGVDLLAPFGYLGIGGQLIAQTSHDADAVPAFDNLGAGANLYFVTES